MTNAGRTLSASGMMILAVAFGVLCAEGMGERRATAQTPGTGVTARPDAGTERGTPAASKPTDKKTDATPVRPPRKDGDLLACSFDHIKFEMEKNAEFKREMITKDIEALVGKKIRISGYILPTFQSKLKYFVLVRDNMECCFGPGAMLYDCVIVEMNGDTTASYTTRPVTVEGVFGIEVRKDLDDRVESIYTLKGESVR